MNAVAAISITGLVGLELTTSTVNADNFLDFARGCLIPYMMPFHGTNPRSVVVMDNLSVHHVPAVQDCWNFSTVPTTLQSRSQPNRGNILLCEKSTCASMKNFSKHEELLQVIPNPVDIINSAFTSLTGDK